MFSEALLDLPSIHGLVRGCVRAVPGRVILCGEGCKLFKQRPCGKCYLKVGIVYAHFHANMSLTRSSYF